MKQLHKILLVAGLAFSSASMAETLRVLCYEGYITNDIAADFSKMMKEKGKDVSLTITLINDPQEIFDGLRGRDFDVVTPTHNIPKSEKWKLIDVNLVQPLNLANIPNYKSLIPSLQNAEYMSAEGKVYGVPYIYGPYGLAYNADKIKPAPTSWGELLDPKYFGMYAISSDYHEANVYVAALASGVTREDIFDAAKLMENKAVINNLAKLAKGAQVMWKGVDTADTLAGLSLATSWGFALPELNKRGENWKMAYPKEGVTGWVDNIMLSSALGATPEKLAMAEDLLNYLISPQVQADNVMRALGSYPVNTEVKKLATAEETVTFKLDNPDFFRKEFILWKTLTTRDQNGFKSMWLKAKEI